MQSKLSVAIVEDHAVTRLGLSAALSLAPDIEVVGATSGVREGLALCQTHQPDILLLDLHLPDSDNVRQLVQTFLPLSKHVVVFSSEARRPFVETVLSMSVSGYLLKSEPIENILDALRRVASGTTPVISVELDRDNVSLTPAEKHLLTMLGQGMKYEHIAHLRKTAPDTVKKQCERLLIKLDLGTREELISWAAQHGYANVETENR